MCTKDSACSLLDISEGVCLNNQPYDDDDEGRKTVGKRGEFRCYSISFNDTEDDDNGDTRNMMMMVPW